jgi:hypothetical protein
MPPQAQFSYDCRLTLALRRCEEIARKRAWQAEPPAPSENAGLVVVAQAVPPAWLDSFLLNGKLKPELLTTGDLRP